MSFFSRLYNFLKRRIEILHSSYLDSNFYLKHFFRNRVERIAKDIRQKPTITVAFVLHDISKWKTESLYLAMQKHPRFNPILVTTFAGCQSYLSSSTNYIKLVNSLKEKDYPFIQASRAINIEDLVSPDIIFYQEPYKWIVPDLDFYKSNNNVLYCYVTYGFHNIINQSLSNQFLYNHLWQHYFENESVIKDVALIMDNKGINSLATGHPFSDAFLRPVSEIPNQWKSTDKKQKKIIWAPHHTIPGVYNVFEQSTFLTIADAMLELAEKYKDRIQWAFKPHPLLYTKLIDVWGVEKTDEYFSKWANNEYSQIETGEYVGLFMHSDAMIHDCSSFIIEYHYSNNPVFFIENGSNIQDDYSTYSREAYNLHYKGTTIEDIENFINDVVLDGNDSLKEQREKFFETYLLPPNDKTASENIIDAILGNK